MANKEPSDLLYIMPGLLLMMFLIILEKGFTMPEPANQWSGAYTQRHISHSPHNIETGRIGAVMENPKSPDGQEDLS